MKARFIRLWAAPILLLCIFAAGTATTAQAKSIDPALLAKANAGDAEAQYQLGNMYNFGDGVRPDYAQALIWYRKSAEQGNADSEFQLGGLYHFGHGVPQDDAQGFAWIMKAAEQGDGDARFFIAVSYSEGWGVAKDEAQSSFWLLKAAVHGHTNSERFLGRAYENGNGVRQDYQQAYFWLDLASLGDVPSRKRKEIVKEREKAASHLAPIDVTYAQDAVRRWLEDHPAHSQ